MEGDYNFSSDVDVMRLGTDIGIELMDKLKEMVAEIDQQRRIYFFSALLRVQVECMVRSIGGEATRAICDTAEEHVRSIGGRGANG